jgi:PAS domain S-box-containing protein
VSGGGHTGGLSDFKLAGKQIPGDQARLAALVQGYGRIPGQLAIAETAQRKWLASVATPELQDAAAGNFAKVQAFQADSGFIRPYVVAVRIQMAALQAQITAMQARVTDHLISEQTLLLAALIAVSVVALAITVCGLVVVRWWLLRPFLLLREAADAVAGGDYDTTVPEVGPAELAALGRSAELMRTRLVDALAKAEKAERAFRGLFNSAPDATVAVKEDGSIVMINAQAERLFGYTAQELIGESVEVLVPEAARERHPQQRNEYFADPAPRPMAAEQDLSALAKSGREIPVEISLSAVQASFGMVASASIRDISERLAVQEERDRLRAEAERERYASRLQQAERLESLGQLVGGVAHDFNNLLNVISGYNEFTAQKLAQFSAGDPRLATILDDVEYVRGATERAARLTRQLLIFARRDVVHPQVLNVNHVVAGLETLLRRTLGEHIGLVIAPGPGTWPVKIDAGQLEQVIVNLAVNARDAMPSGGTLSIDTGNIDADEAYAESRPDLLPGRYARLRVSDTGIGMAPEVQAKIFEPFYTTKGTGRGTGLGLATVYGIITRAGGNIQVYSEVGLGTTFSVLLPATDEPSEGETVAIPAPRRSAPAAGRGETILIAEDERSLWELARRILVHAGYRVCDASTPAECIAMAQNQQQSIALLLTDAVMPEMLGNRLAARIRDLRPGLPVLYMSGYAQAMLHTQGALGGRIDLMEKPFSESTLLSRVREAIDNGSGIDGVETRLGDLDRPLGQA